MNLNLDANSRVLDMSKLINYLGFIYSRVEPNMKANTKANAKATLLLTCCIVSNLCIYTTATAVAANIKEKDRFRSNINEPLLLVEMCNSLNLNILSISITSFWYTGRRSTRIPTPMGIISRRLSNASLCSARIH